jgi:ABC-type transport system involved in multi-copper enzyme maturation permease subunit
MTDMPATPQPPEPSQSRGSPAQAPSPALGRLRAPLLGLTRIAGGIGAVGVKELRGRMRGRRAFVILTIYLLLLGGFAWMVELIMERSTSSGFGGTGTYAGASIGQGIFAALLMLETLQVAFLAPSATAGAISLEREKQTLELLVATPISSIAIVLGKLVSALVYVWLLIAASIPLTAVVFVYGGVAPDDVLRGYVVLVVTALGLGSFGIFCSSLVRRTQAATAITIFGVLLTTIGSVFLLAFWGVMTTRDNGDGNGPVRGTAPQEIAYLNPFLAEVDVLCGTETSLGGWCGIESSLLPNQNGVVFVGGGGNQAVPVFAPPAPVQFGNAGQGALRIAPTVGDAVGVAADVAPFGIVRDGFWPRSVAAWLILSAVFLLLSVQFVSPTRRWRLRRFPSDRGSAS